MSKASGVSGAPYRFFPTVRLSKNLRTKKGSRLGNTGNRLEFQSISFFKGTNVNSLRYTLLQKLELSWNLFKMVQGEAKFSSVIDYSIAKSSKEQQCSKSQKQEQKMTDKDYKQKINNQKNYGAWGPTFKNRQNFNEMHFF